MKFNHSPNNNMLLLCLFIKDMKLADEEALAEHTKLGMLEYVLGMYEKLQEEGLGDLGTQALIKYYEK